ncbi:hypothetical protein [Amycolatopsis vancoresmycina]|uniref:Uncharacterized protein n=1 Tax=Amycolatopsis vancoresmycina DSM 44592 TaxID=1292037 RepID=R1ICU3_9PSEU|nr:hypothetical protein [Amycolatopsis vancoresmycina]EOD70341.1 hypothetical protein H480_01457 [Amycolatopsis vancoresmycina DSM 44592]
MSQVNYPAVVHAPHFVVEKLTARGRLQRLSARVYSSREDAETWASVLRGAGDVVFITEYGVAYYARCVVCGEYPDHERMRFVDWAELVQYLAQEPGWRSTSEQLVFCPHHRPAGATE